MAGAGVVHQLAVKVPGAGGLHHLGRPARRGSRRGRGAGGSCGSCCSCGLLSGAVVGGLTPCVGPPVGVVLVGVGGHGLTVEAGDLERTSGFSSAGASCTTATSRRIGQHGIGEHLPQCPVLGPRRGDERDAESGVLHPLQRRLLVALKALSANGTRPASRPADLPWVRAPQIRPRNPTRPFTPNACSVSPTPHYTNRAPVSASTPGSTPPITSRSPTWVTTDPVHPTVGASTLGHGVGTDRY